MLKVNEQRRNRYVHYKKDKRSRLLLSSGGDRPVMDGGGGEHSVFAKAFLDTLINNKGLITAPEIYEQVRKRVIGETHSIDFTQVPEYKTIRGAGHELGDFFFIPVQASNKTSHRYTSKVYAKKVEVDEINITSATALTSP